MSKINDGGPAFPFGVRREMVDTYGGGEPYVEEMNIPVTSLRDYFAIRAPMPTANGLRRSWAESLLGRKLPQLGEGIREDIRFWLEAEAKYRYAFADAMLAARAATPAKEADHG